MMLPFQSSHPQFQSSPLHFPFPIFPCQGAGLEVDWRKRLIRHWSLSSWPWATGRGRSPLSESTSSASWRQKDGERGDQWSRNVLLRFQNSWGSEEGEKYEERCNESCLLCVWIFCWLNVVILVEIATQFEVTKVLFRTQIHKEHYNCVSLLQVN